MGTNAQAAAGLVTTRPGPRQEGATGKTNTDFKQESSPQNLGGSVGPTPTVGGPWKHPEDAPQLS